MVYWLIISFLGELMVLAQQHCLKETQRSTAQLRCCPDKGHTGNPDYRTYRIFWLYIFYTQKYCAGWYFFLCRRCGCSWNTDLPAYRKGSISINLAFVFGSDMHLNWASIWYALIFYSEVSALYGSQYRSVRHSLKQVDKPMSWRNSRSRLPVLPGNRPMDINRRWNDRKNKITDQRKGIAGCFLSCFAGMGKKGRPGC